MSKKIKSSLFTFVTISTSVVMLLILSHITFRSNAKTMVDTSSHMAKSVRKNQVNQDSVNHYVNRSRIAAARGDFDASDSLFKIAESFIKPKSK